MWASINYVDKQGGVAQRSKVNETAYAYLVNLSAKDGGVCVKNPQNSINVIYGCPLNQNVSCEIGTPQHRGSPGVHKLLLYLYFLCIKGAISVAK